MSEAAHAPCPTPIDYLARWRELVLARAEQGRRLDPEDKRADHWGGQRAQRFQRYVETATEGDPLTELLQPFVGPQTTVLDVGAGPGRHVLPLARQVKRVVAVEPSDAMRSLLSKNVENAGLANVDVIGGEWPEISALLDQVDVAICSHVVYGTAEIAPFVQALDRVARGRIVMALRFGQREAAILDLFARVWGEPRCLAPTAVDLFGALVQLGVHPNVQVVPFPQRPRFEDVEDAVAQVKADLLNPPSPEVDALIRTDLAERLVAREGKLTLDTSPAYAGLLHWDSVTNGSSQ